MNALVSIGLAHYLVVASILFVAGLITVATRRNAVAILMGVELILNAASLNFVAFSRSVSPAELTGHIFAIFVMAIAAAEAAVGLAIVITIYRNRSEITVDDVNMLKW